MELRFFCGFLSISVHWFQLSLELRRFQRKKALLSRTFPARLAISYFPGVTAVDQVTDERKVEFLLWYEPRFLCCKDSKTHEGGFFPSFTCLRKCLLLVGTGLALLFCWDAPECQVCASSPSVLRAHATGVRDFSEGILLIALWWLILPLLLASPD